MVKRVKKQARSVDINGVTRPELIALLDLLGSVTNGLLPRDEDIGSLRLLHVRLKNLEDRWARTGEPISTSPDENDVEEDFAW